MDHVSPPPKRRPGRPAGDGARRDAILDAAKSLFSAHGFEGASLRAIAATASVDPALIRHFFKDKDGLFVAVISNRTTITERLGRAFPGDPAYLGERLSETYLGLWDDGDTGPILRAMVRTAFTSDRSAGMLSDLLTARIATDMNPELAAQEEMSLRVMLAGAHLFGIASARYLACAEPLTAIDRCRLVAIVAPIVQHLLTGTLPAECH